jgi:outer membrane protein|tara:strand:+ start:3007 stop:3648 length:642 start_codon:yes stop_codon:yes gene_type:complete
MKNLSLGLNAVLILAVAILYYLHFSSATPVEETVVESLVEMKEDPVNETGKIASKIGYLNTDSLRANYKFYDELIAKLKGRERKYEKELSSKSAAFEKEVMEFQQKAPTMTQFEGQMRQKELGKKEKDLYALQEKFAIKFQNEQTKLDEEFQNKVNNFIKNYNTEAGYNLIIGASKMGNVVLDYNEGLNITNEIVSGLNEQYDIENAPKEVQK